MSGRENWHGSGFHADVVTERVLAGLIVVRNAQRNGAAPPMLPDYWIEHAATNVGPDWDVVEHCGATRILEELKSGHIAAEERRAMWIRARRACAAGIPVHNLILRLTADRERVKLAAAWQGLATAPCPARVPARPPKKVTSAGALLCEALVYLTHRDLRFDKNRNRNRRHVDVGPPLTVSDAAALLSRFEFSADRARSEVRARITELLRELRSGMTAEVLQTWLLGHFFEVAQASGAIQPIRLAAAVPLVESILYLEPEVNRLVERVLESEPPPTRTSRLAMRGWREVQPHVAQGVDELSATEQGGFLVLTGEAGLGKSTVLAGIFRDLKDRGQQVAWLSLGYDGGPPPTPNQLARAVRLLAQRTTWSGRPCWLLIDGIDGDPDNLYYLRPTEKLRVIVSARTESYEPRRQFEATELALARWSPSDVVDAFGAELPPDVVVLLGNPFLLSLALEIPTGSVRRPTRFAILSRYLGDIVFARGVEGVAARRCMDAMAQGLVRGSSWTTPPAAGLQPLLNHGVAAAPGGGRVRFGHPLFSEIAVAMWAAHRDAALCVRRLSRIRDSFLRASALRIVLEGCVDAGDSTRLLDLPELGALVAAGLNEGADIVGGLASLDVVVPEVLRHPRSPEFAARLFEAAKLADQRSWLAAVALLDIEPRPAWATVGSRDDALPQLAEHLAACGDGLAADHRRAVAIRLRAWSAGQGSLWTSYLVDVLAAELPDNGTLDWISSVVSVGVAGWLRRGIRRVCSRGIDLDPAHVRATIQRVVSADRESDLDRYQDAHDLMLGEKGDRGLIETQPEIAMELILEWQEEEDLRDRELRQQRRDEFEGLAPLLDEGAADA